MNKIPLFITESYRSISQKMPQLRPISDNYRIRPSDIGYILNIISAKHGMKGYKLYTILAIQGECYIVFKKKNFVERLFSLDF